MISYALKKDGKTVKKGWFSMKEFEAFMTENGGDELVLKRPVVEVLSFQQDAEPSGEKD